MLLIFEADSLLESMSSVDDAEEAGAFKKMNNLCTRLLVYKPSYMEIVAFEVYRKNYRNISKSTRQRRCKRRTSMRRCANQAISARGRCQLQVVKQFVATIKEKAMVQMYSKA